MRAKAAREPLRDDGAERRSEQEGLDAEVDQAHDRARGVLCVQGRQQEMSRQRGLDHNRRGLAVTDLADHDDVGVGTQDRAESTGKRELGTAVDLQL